MVFRGFNIGLSSPVLLVRPYVCQQWIWATARRPPASPPPLLTVGQGEATLLMFIIINIVITGTIITAWGPQYSSFFPSISI